MNRNINIIAILAVMMACTPPPKKDIKSTPESKPDHSALLWVYKPKINVRSAASARGRLLAQLTDGDSVSVLKNESGWYEVRLADNRTGWIRSDLLAPRSFSAFLRAGDFIEDLRKEGTELFFDKDEHHKRIALRFPAPLYRSKQSILKKTSTVVSEYQNIVYAGNVTAVVLNADGQGEYLRKEFKGNINADPVIPVIPYGRLQSIEQPERSRLRMNILLSNTVSKNKLLSAARRMAGTFPISYEMIEIVFRSGENNCVLWFSEDAGGEQYRFDKCSE